MAVAKEATITKRLQISLGALFINSIANGRSSVIAKDTYPSEILIVLSVLSA
jgi:hypothetical protein